MIKTPVTVKIEWGKYHVVDTNGATVCRCGDNKAFADQIVTALNAQQPTLICPNPDCKTNYSLMKYCMICRKPMHPHSIAQQPKCESDCQPAEPSGGLVQKLIDAINQPFTVVTHGDYSLSAEDIIELFKQAAAHIVALEKAGGIARKWAKYPDFLPEQAPSEDEIIAAYNYRIERIKAALGDKEQDEQPPNNII